MVPDPEKKGSGLVKLSLDCGGKVTPPMVQFA